MSIFNLIDTKISKTLELYSDVLNVFNNNESVKQGAAFMLYSLDTIFKDFEFEDIEEGIVDSSYRQETHDYGIDAIYLSANGEVVNSVEQLDEFNEDTKFVFHILQFKKSRGIEQSDLLKFKEGIKRVFIENDIDARKNEYLFNRATELNDIKLSIYQAFSAEQVHIKLYMVFTGLKENIEKDELLTTQISAIKELLIENAYLGNSFSVLGAQELLNLSKQGEEIVDIVKYVKTLKYITEIERNKKLNGYISIMNASEIAKLVKNWQTAIFEANIRDYYRRNDLNKKIIQTSVSKEEAKYFWSFNNGLTITCRKVEELPNDQYRLYGIQIVNGCQTSNALYQAASNLERAEILKEKEIRGELNRTEERELENIQNQVLNPDTTVLTKIIETNSGELVYRITETTNSQTPIKSFSLKANEDIQQNIEEYFLNNNIYYERRVNFYRNQGKRNVISIQKLFQVFTAQILFRPSEVRTRPKALFTNFYDEVFPAPNSGVIFDYVLHLIPVKVDLKINKRIREIQKDSLEDDRYNQMLMTYGKLHLGSLLLHTIVGAYSKNTLVRHKEKIFEVLEDEARFNELFSVALENLRRIVRGFAGNRRESIPLSVRKTELDERIVKFINSNKTS
ncbi:MAG TPA: AIPR family protein [Pyrinomonadaceae bacterium]|jgi:hypothetical protein